jgi:hypothetical protein
VSDPDRHKADERSEKHDGCRPSSRLIKERSGHRGFRWSDGKPEATEIVISARRGIVVVKSLYYVGA